VENLESRPVRNQAILESLVNEMRWRAKSNQQARRQEETAATKWWEHQQVAQELNIPVIYKPLNGSPIKLVPFVRAPTNTNNK